MTTGIAIAGIAVALLVGAISPGPSFVFVAQTAVAGSRRQGVLAGLGMGCGGVVFAALALAGLQTVLARTAWLDTGLRLLGGVYLLFLAWRLWPTRATSSATANGIMDVRKPVARPFLLGLVTQLSNPKTALVYAGIFAALLPASLEWNSRAVLLGVVMLVEGGWYCLVALAFASARPRALYLKAQPLIDRVAASIIGALGVRLLMSSRS